MPEVTSLTLSSSVSLFSDGQNRTGRVRECDNFSLLLLIGADCKALDNQCFALIMKRDCPCGHTVCFKIMLHCLCCLYSMTKLQQYTCTVTMTNAQAKPSMLCCISLLHLFVYTLQTGRVHGHRDHFQQRQVQTFLTVTVQLIISPMHPLHLLHLSTNTLQSGQMHRHHNYFQQRQVQTQGWRCYHIRFCFSYRKRLRFQPDSRPG